MLYEQLNTLLGSGVFNSDGAFPVSGGTLRAVEADFALTRRRDVEVSIVEDLLILFERYLDDKHGNFQVRGLMLVA